MKVKFICEECGKIFCRNVSKEDILTVPSLYKKYGIIEIIGTVKCNCGNHNVFPVSMKTLKHIFKI